jgi:ABC-type branched-subunit amino acid transport system ATPase component/branched-subunit amino acid ABC-type transport system permease component
VEGHARDKSNYRSDETHPVTEILQYAVLGLGAAVGYTLLGSGVMLINRGSGVVNFAQGAMALVAALLYYSFSDRMSMPFPIAILLSIVVTALLGTLVYLTIMRPLAQSSTTARTIATLGLLILIQGVVVLVWGVGPFNVVRFLPAGTFEVLGVVVSWDRLILIGIAALVTVVLWFTAKYTATGLALRALAENARATSTLAWSPIKLGILTWTIGAGLAGLAGTLIAPITTISVDTMPLMIIPVLAAVLLASFKSFPILLLASAVIGIGQSLLFNFVPIQGMSQSLPFILILILLIVRGREHISRTHLVERLPAVGTGRVFWKTLAVIIALIAAGILFLFNDQFLAATTATFGWSLIVLSVVILIGYSGQLSLAQATLAGIAGLIAARLVADLAVPLPLAIIAAVAATVLIGLTVALPALRTRGINLAIVTLGIASITSEFIFKNSFFSGDFGSVIVPTVELFGLDLTPILNPQGYALFALVLFIVCCVVAAAVRRGTAGGRLLAVRTNDRAASALGVDVVGAKFFAFGLSAAIAAIGGIILAFSTPAFNPSAFNPTQSISVIAYAFVGGVGFIIGAPAGGQFAPGSFGSWLLDMIWPGATSVWLQVISGATVILFILLQPDGFASDWVKGARAIKARLSRAPATSVHQEAPLGDDGAATADNAGRQEAEAVGLVQVAAEFDQEADAGAPLETLRVPPVRLEVHGLGVRFGQKVIAVNDVSFTVEPGEVVALIGPNGAGKSTCIDAITGFVPSTGRVLLNDGDVSDDRAYQRSRKGMARSFQSLELFESLTVRDNLLIAADDGRARHYLRDIVWPRRPELGPLALAVIMEFGLTDVLDQRVDDLPYGQRRLVAVARALAGSPSVLLLDEPAAGLGDDETKDFDAVIRKIASWGVAVLLVEHDMGLVMAVSDRVVVMETGKRLAIGRPEEIQQNPAVVAAYLGGQGAAPASASANAAGYDMENAEVTS